jgi:hypothetical protein
MAVTGHGYLGQLASRGEAPVSLPLATEWYTKGGPVYTAIRPKRQQS